MSIFDYNDPIISQFRDIYVDKTESFKVVNNKVVLSELPSKFDKVYITPTAINWIEVESESPNQGTYHVDYVNGVVTFNPSDDGKTLEFSYKAKGIQFYPVSRVYTKELNGSVTETLQDLINSGETAITNLDDIANFKHVGEYVSGNSYNHYNIVSFNGSSYMATADNTTDPTDTSNWKEIGRGNEFKGLYSTSTTYQRGGQVVDANFETVYISKINNNTNNPLTDTTSWSKSIDISDVMATANNKIADLNNLESTVSTNETTRQNNESTRETNEANRINSESTRETNENTRISNESTRQTNETNRESNETTRQNNESTRQTNETSRVSAEDTRILNETDRENAEATRISNEDTRQTNETTRQNQETQRQTDTATAISNAETATTNAQNVADQTKYVEPFSSTTTYAKNNIVSYSGSSFMSLQDGNVGNTPDPSTDTLYWGIVAKKGLDGTGSGTVTEVKSTTGDITVTNPTDTPDLAISSTLKDSWNAKVDLSVGTTAPTTGGFIFIDTN